MAEQATFSADGAAYLYAWTTLQQLPEFVVGWNFLFTFGLRSATTEIVYELVLPLGGPRAGDYSPFVARRSVSGKNDGAIRGYYEYPARTFSGLTAIDPNAHIDAPYAVFSLPSVGKPADLSIDSNFQPELQSASFFGTLVPAPSGVTVAPRWLTTRRFLMNMLGTCVQVGGAAGGAAFLGSGGNVGVGVAVGAVGCLAGALGQGIKDLGEFLDQWEQGGGGAGPHPTAGPAGGSSSGSGPIPKDKDQ